MIRGCVLMFVFASVVTACHGDPERRYTDPLPGATPDPQDGCRTYAIRSELEPNGSTAPQVETCQFTGTELSCTQPSYGYRSDVRRFAGVAEFIAEERLGATFASSSSYRYSTTHDAGNGVVSEGLDRAYHYDDSGRLALTNNDYYEDWRESDPYFSDQFTFSEFDDAGRPVAGGWGTQETGSVCDFSIAYDEVDRSVHVSGRSPRGCREEFYRFDQDGNLLAVGKTAADARPLSVLETAEICLP